LALLKIIFSDPKGQDAVAYYVLFDVNTAADI
jgi:hypothetical protein